MPTHNNWIFCAHSTKLGSVRWGNPHLDLEIRISDFATEHEIRPRGGFQLRYPNPDFMDFFFTVQSGSPKRICKIFSWTVVFSLLIMRSRVRPLSLRTLYQSFFEFPKKRKERESKNRYLSVSNIYLHVGSKSFEKEVFRQLYAIKISVWIPLKSLDSNVPYSNV